MQNRAQQNAERSREIVTRLKHLSFELDALVDKINHATAELKRVRVLETQLQQELKYLCPLDTAELLASVDGSDIDNVNHAAIHAIRDVVWHGLSAWGSPEAVPPYRLSEVSIDVADRLRDDGFLAQDARFEDGAWIALKQVVLAQLAFVLNA